jgi:hypothetical protein
MLSTTQKLNVSILVAIFLLLFARPGTAQNVSQRLQWHADAGYFLPNEGDLDGGGIVGFGLEATKGADTLFGAAYFSRTNVNANILGIGDVDNYMLQIGYMTDFGKWERGKVGFGLQLHQMDIGNTSTKITRTVPIFIGKYQMMNRLSLRFTSGAAIKKDGIRFGGYGLFASYDVN